MVRRQVREEEEEGEREVREEEEGRERRLSQKSRELGYLSRKKVTFDH